MASLKEVKNRISTVNNTRKITGAMKMVASSKLHRAQRNIERMRPYEEQLDKMMSTFVQSMEGDVSSPYAVKREVHRAAVVLFTSNSSLCGAFNANAIKAAQQVLREYADKGIEVVRVYPIGKKGYEAVRKSGFTPYGDYSALPDHPRYDTVADIARELMQAYVEGGIDEVTLVYHHFKSTASQVLTRETMLPVSLDAKSGGKQEKGPALDYIVEPSREEVLEALIPQALCLKLFTALLDNVASEHGARVIAMQIATDNADELLRELTLTYNKTRQQAITTELLDIVGGSMS